jgi:hypothetical protein
MFGLHMLQHRSSLLPFITTSRIKHVSLPIAHISVLTTSPDQAGERPDRSQVWYASPFIYLGIDECTHQSVVEPAGSFVCLPCSLDMNPLHRFSFSQSTEPGKLIDTTVRDYDLSETGKLVSPHSIFPFR